MVLGATSWIVGGWLAGIPAGLTTFVAIGLWADVSRTLAFEALTARVRALAHDLGHAVWPMSPGQLIPVKGPSRLLWWRLRR